MIMLNQFNRFQKKLFSGGLLNKGTFRFHLEGESIVGLNEFQQNFHGFPGHSFDRLGYICEGCIEEIELAASVEADDAEVFRYTDSQIADMLKTLYCNRVGRENYRV